MKTLEESLDIRREIGDRAGEAVTCWNLAIAYERSGDFFKAVEFARQTVAIEEETNHPDLEKNKATLQKLEQALAAQGDESKKDC